MQRRDLLKALAAIPIVPMVVGGQTVEVAEPEKGKFIIFANVLAVDIRVLCEMPAEPGDPLEGALIIPIKCMGGRSVQDEIAIYRLDEEAPDAEAPREG